MRKSVRFIIIVVCILMIGCQGRPESKININFHDLSKKNNDQAGYQIEKQTSKNGRDVVYNIRPQHSSPRTRSNNYRKYTFRQKYDSRDIPKNRYEKREEPRYYSQNRYYNDYRQQNRQLPFKWDEVNRDIDDVNEEFENRYNNKKLYSIIAKKYYKMKKEEEGREEEIPKPLSLRQQEKYADRVDNYYFSKQPGKIGRNSLMFSLLIRVAKDAYIAQDSRELMLVLYLLKKRNLTANAIRDLYFWEHRLAELLRSQKMEINMYEVSHQAIDLLFNMAEKAFQDNKIQNLIVCIKMLEQEKLSKYNIKRLDYLKERTRNT